MKPIIALLALLSLATSALATQGRIVLDDFERGVYSGWRFQGDCWGSGPVNSRFGGARFSGWSGSYYLSSAHPRPGDNRLVGGKGVASSPEFVVTHSELRFRIGGGNYPGQCCLNLVVRGEDGAERVVRTQTGNDSDRLSEESWDLTELAGKRVHLEVVDNLAFGSQAYILIDDLELAGNTLTPTPSPAALPEPEPVPEPVAPVTPAPLAPRPGRTGPVLRVEGKLPRPRTTTTPPAGRELVLEATGYGPGENGPWGDRTARGTKVGYGTVAVDPKVIPLGTRLWVEGYGTCIALDTGGAIKGMRIDLGFDDDVTANRYGRKKVRVVILD